ncbi:carbonic anhydrase [Caldalkalibacillus mannanilyticus]|uniref:carbonic anhydrase n=1 Tax=Caldalkalibacillus mannanilyticus TaxID=1418 RepID=UPI000469C8ED|nr:carbonic anhydrase [Caldalkalibacillus mannanilyticus]
MKKITFYRGVLVTVLAFSLTACSSTPTQTGLQNENVEGKESTEIHKEAEYEATHWSYEGETGAEHWGSIDPSFATCAEGTEQSPIDIELSDGELEKSVEDIQINYSPTPMTVMNNGHTIQVNDTTDKNSIVVEGKEYKLLQMHFHKPSEHQLNGLSFEMEGHLVHKSSEGNLAVLGFLITSGNENKELAEVWSKLPEERTKVDIPLDQTIDLATLLPEEKKSYLYKGSLTTPPCSEGVKWIVLEQPIELSREQIDAFSAIFPDNHRPVQPINNRELKKH